MVTKKEYIELISIPVNYTCTNLAKHLEDVSHDVVNDYLHRERLTASHLWEQVKPLLKDSADSYLIKEYPASVTVVGYRDESFIYLLPEIALREVIKVQPLRFSATAIGMQLKEDGLLLAGNTSLTIQKRVNGARVRLWQLTAQSLGYDDCDD